MNFPTPTVTKCPIIFLPRRLRRDYTLGQRWARFILAHVANNGLRWASLIQHRQSQSYALDPIYSEQRFSDVSFCFEDYCLMCIKLICSDEMSPRNDWLSLVRLTIVSPPPFCLCQQLLQTESSTSNSVHLYASNRSNPCALCAHIVALHFTYSQNNFLSITKNSLRNCQSKARF